MKTVSSRYFKTIAALTLGAALFSARPVSAADAGTFPLDSRESSLKFFGETLMHNFHGEAKEFSGSAMVSPDAAPPIQHATLHFKTAALTTFLGMRDKKMRSWLNVEANPEATFQLQSVKRISGDYKAADAAHPSEFKVAGVFTLNGARQPITGTAKGWREKNRLVVSGETVVDTLKYGLPQISVMALPVATNVKISYTFSFALPPAYAKP